ncbi:SAC3/GANP/Nin1/mts3/eIF-3 p25 family-domain-containing protein [Papiliotrema laurentii]|uniref:SAC3/GANP/Nin1/mts3/eIF-3 p25 family-domain-containing protein n=1 Tax=Papiliotrema laurentii TaxID=5418 RepID=A0AAD9FTP6_PAPLA|nr:SAC3/GANP/Nin1/mts3/eIF-3 p25 family-domain-containing protein [Papiliotrema laurentii]
MSSSSWPPELKAWVQECLAKATPSNKMAVSAELKQVLFEAHKNGTISSTDWSKVQLASLKAQAMRTTHVPAPPRAAYPVVVPPPTTVPTYVPPYTPSSPSSSMTSHDHHREDTWGAKKDKKSNKTKKSNKRKSDTDTTNAAASSSFPSPYHFASNSVDAEALARRAARFSKPSASTSSQVAQPTGVNGWFGGDDEDEGGSGFSHIPSQVGVKKMKGIGGLGYSGAMPLEVDPNVIDWDKFTIKGTNTRLEKSYLRLTSEPSPADIRPLHVLKQTLQLVKRKWKENANYAYAVDQFKSMRQDLTVQRIKNEFTVEVYEMHARIALEAKDLGEYNQCQTMLRQLYELGIPGHPEEFMSYRIMYLLHTRNRSDMASLLAQLTPAEKADPGIHHALQTAAALATSNYVRFFRLYNTAPNMSGYIMDHFVERERMSALAIMSKAYLTLTLPYLTVTLAFDSDSQTDQFLADHDIAIYTNPTVQPPPTAEPHRPNAWRPIKAAPPTPMHERTWDCKKAQAGVSKGMERYRVVDLKGQVD